MSSPLPHLTLNCDGSDTARFYNASFEVLRMWLHHKLCNNRTGWIKIDFHYFSDTSDTSFGSCRCRWKKPSTARTVCPPCFLSDVALSWPVVVQSWGDFASVSCEDYVPWSASLQAVWSLQWLTATSDYRIVSLDIMETK